MPCYIFWNGKAQCHQALRLPQTSAASRIAYVEAIIHCVTPFYALSRFQTHFSQLVGKHTTIVFLALQSRSQQGIQAL